MTGELTRCYRNNCDNYAWSVVQWNKGFYGFKNPEPICNDHAPLVGAYGEIKPRRKKVE